MYIFNKQTGYPNALVQSTLLQTTYMCPFLYVVRDQALFIERNYRYSFGSKYTMDLCDRPRHLFDVIHK